MSSTVGLLLRVTAWYACAVAASIYTKAGLVLALRAGFDKPLSELCAVLLITGLQLAATGAAAHALHSLRSSSSPKSKSMDAGASLRSTPLPAIHTLANLATNAAMVASNAAVVQAFKAMEPVFTLLFAAESLTAAKAGGVALVIAGGIACGGLQMGSALATSAGEAAILFALASNALFSWRNVQVKLLVRAQPDLDGVRVLALCCTTGALACMLGALPMFLFMRDVRAATAHLTLAFAVDVILASACTAGYNVASFLVLEGVSSALTHALIGVGKRVCVVVIAGLMSGTLTLQAAGAFAVMVAGLLLHSGMLVRTAARKEA